MSRVVVERAGLVESAHRVQVAVVDSEGRLTASAGDSEHEALARSILSKANLDESDVECGPDLPLDRLAGATDGSFGMAVKVEDGAKRAIPVAVMHVLDGLGLLEGFELEGVESEALNAFRRTNVTNTLGEDVGVIRADFQLETHT